jgi:uncharacterized membrane protein YbhN (UPF0104 family)
VRNVIYASLGMAVGALMLWLALSKVDLAEAGQALERGRIGPMALAVCVYWLSIAMRIARWRLILSGSAQLSYGKVGQALIVGYSVNNLLPARLGELFRADYLRRRFGVERAIALGSIVVERLMDGVFALILLATGLIFLGPGSDHSSLVNATTVGAAVIGAALAGACGIAVFHDRLPLDRLPWVERRIGMFASSMMVVRRPVFITALLLSGGIWLSETVCLVLIAAIFNATIDVAGALVLIGAVSFSTLLPSAPGYIGSLQAAFVLVFLALGLPTVLGLLSATAMQVLLLGPMLIAGLAILLVGMGLAARNRPAGEGVRKSSGR